MPPMAPPMRASARRMRRSTTGSSVTAGGRSARRARPTWSVRDRASSLPSSAPSSMSPSRDDQASLRFGSTWSDPSRVGGGGTGGADRSGGVDGGAGSSGFCCGPTAGLRSRGGRRGAFGRGALSDDGIMTLPVRRAWRVPTRARRRHRSLDVARAPATRAYGRAPGCFDRAECARGAQALQATASLLRTIVRHRELWSGHTACTRGAP